MLRNNKGETLIETLVSVAILAIVIAGFSGVVTDVIHTNTTIKNMRMTYNYNGTHQASTKSWSITVSNSNNVSYSYDLSKIHRYEENGLYFYE